MVTNYAALEVAEGKVTDLEEAQEAFQTQIDKVELFSSGNTSETQFQLGMRWDYLSEDIKDQPVNDVFDKLKVTLYSADNQELATIELALNNNPGEGNYIESGILQKKVDATTIQYNAKEARGAKAGVTAWYTSAYFGADNDDATIIPAKAKLEVVDKNGNEAKITQDVTK